MTVDFLSVQTGAAGLMLVSFGLFFIRKPFVQFFAAFLFVLLALELLLPYVGVGNEFLRIVHAPSAFLIGGDGIPTAGDGTWGGAAFHLADLVLWSAVLAVPFAMRETWWRKHPDERGLKR